MAKIRIRIGEIEVECEGEESFVKTEFPFLMEKINKSKGALVVAGTSNHFKSPSGKLSVSSIIQKTSETDGSGVLFAACAYLTLTGKETFGRDEIIAAARLATTYYKKTVLKNMTKYLKTLTKNGSLNDLGSDKYSLGEQGIAKIKQLFPE